MSKQEEIREGVAEILSSLEGGRGGAEYRLTDNILSYLHSQGVVIKVKKSIMDVPLPEMGFDAYTREGVISKCHLTKLKILEAGYVVVEPLIEGG